MPKDDDPNTSGGAEKANDAKQNSGQASASGAQPASASGAQSPQGQSTDKAAESASALLKADHQQVEKLFAEFDGADDRRKNEIIQQACQDLILHTLVEEEIFYPACRKAASDDEPLDEAQVEHDSAKLLIVELLDGRRDDPFRQAKFKVLAEQIRHHVAEEEKPRTGIFAKAQAAGIDTPDLGRRIQQRKQQVQGRGDALRPTRPASLERLAGAARPTEEYGMPRNYGPERDDRGRFMSDDDRDDRRRYGAERSGGGGRRYADDDDDRGYRGRERDGGRRGGWFGDSEGHAEASRRGWDNPDHGPSGWYGDSRGHAEASRRGWDNPDHGPSGWYGDSRGHSEASRRGWDNPDHGDSGWYGDPEGHSEASRRGWDERRSFSGRDSERGRDRDRDDDRGRYRARDDEGRFRSRDDDDDRRYRSRSRDDDDDRRSYRGRDRDDDRGQGGWFGDSRGHAEAARRGWEGRR